jgi:hypothetical protein
MRELSTRICAHLVSAGHTVKMGGTISAGTNAAEANAWGAERYVAVHSNAGGGHGTEVWAYKDGSTGAALARAIYNRLAPATDFPDRGVKFSTGYIETSKPNAPAVIIECAFHDNLAEANEIRASLDEWALAIAQGIIDHVGGAIKPTVPTAPASTLLKLGSNGTAVRELQTLLNKFGHGLVVDGDFGPATLAAVKAYQASNGLAADGIVGPLTWAKLRAVTTPPPVVAPPPVVTPPPVCPPDPHPSDANEQIAAYEARETKALALARDLVTLLSQ